MRIKETLTLQDKNNLFVKKDTVGFFVTLFQPTDIFFNLAYPMCLEYYTIRSANKRVAEIYDQILEFVKESSGDESTYIQTTNELLGTNILRPKFLDKWERIYKALITEQYNPLNSYEEEDNKTGSENGTTTYNTEVGKTGNNTDSTTYNTNVEDNGKTSTKETTTTNIERNDDVYGFNSSSPVGESANNEKTTEELLANADDNTTHNIQTKTGNDNKNITINETESKTGTDSNTLSKNENITRSGRRVSASSLIQEELDLRNRQIFFDIVYKDIDSVLTLSVY